MEEVTPLVMKDLWGIPAGLSVVLGVWLILRLILPYVATKKPND